MGMRLSGNEAKWDPYEFCLCGSNPMLYQFHAVRPKRERGLLGAWAKWEWGEVGAWAKWDWD